jgi:hypothetical protein
VAGVTQQKIDLNHTGPLEWMDDVFWDKVSTDGRFCIRGQRIGGKVEYVVWRMGPNGKVIPRWIGVAPSFTEAVELAENDRGGKAPSINLLWKVADEKAG